MPKNLEKIKAEFESSVDDSWMIASLTRILRESMEQDSKIRLIDRLYLASALIKLTDRQKYKLSEIKKSLFGL